MGGRGSHYLILSVVAIGLAAGVLGCGSGDDGVSDDEIFGDTATNKTGAPATRHGMEGRFDVGGHRLYMKCTGSGSPTVVFLHGSVREKGDAGSERAGRVPSLLARGNRVCVYDRANVGRSDSVPGRLTGRSSAKDLKALLSAAHVPGPYVLLGASLGGAIADIYAATYPGGVAGMVLLDSTLPAYLDMYKRLYPPGSGPQPGEWRNEAERLDRLATFREAGEVQDQRRRMPVTYLAAALSVPPKIETAIRTAQRNFIMRFSPGRLVVVDAPHDMARAVPERVAREVEDAILSVRGR